MNSPRIEKLCNAFIPRAEPDTETLPAAALAAVRRYKKKHGGLWVGGKLIVNDDDLLFHPNGLNIALHSNLTNFIIPLEEITSVAWQFGFVTGIVVVEWRDVTIRFRCFGAKNVVKQLQALVGP